MRRAGAALLAVGLLGLVAAAPPGPPGPPQEGPRERNGDHGPGRRWGEWRESDWKEALELFAKHSPLRMKAFESLNEEQKGRFRPLILGRYYAWKFDKDDPQLQGNKIRQMEIEDKVFGLKSDLAAAPADSEEAKLLKTQLREQVKLLVEARLEERALRTARLEALLQQEKDRLSQDRQNLDELVEKRYQEVLAAEINDPLGGSSRFREGDRDKGKGGPGKR